MLFVKNYEISQKIKKIGLVAQAVDTTFQLILRFNMAMRICAFPGLPVVKFYSRHPIAKSYFIYCHAKNIRVVKLPSLLEVTPTLPRTFCPIIVPIAGCCLGFDVH